MKFSLIQIHSEGNGYVDGVWLKDSTGTLDSAIKHAIATEEANSNRIKVAVVESIGVSSPNYNILTNLKRLDQATEKP